MENAAPREMVSPADCENVDNGHFVRSWETNMKTPLLAATLVRADRFRSFQVCASAAGWESLEREDQRVLHERRHTDWHRVEQTLTRFTREIANLRAQGWRDADV